MIPEHRKAIHGRTWDREWQPRAVEHHRRSLFATLADAVFAIILGVVIALTLWSML
jgi:hypothetical protein